MSELFHRMNGQAVRGLVLAVDDTGEAQTITVQTHDDVVRSDVEVLSIHGLATNPGTGATAMLFAVGGDQGHLVSLPLQDFGARFGGLPPGGVTLHDDAGNRLTFPADGTGQLFTAALMRMMVQELLVQAQAGTTFRGPVTFEDAVTFKAAATFQQDVSIAGALHVAGPVTGASFNGKA